MGLFSVRARLPQPAGPKAPVRLHARDIVARTIAGIRALPARLGPPARAAVGTTGSRVRTRLGQARRTAIAATNDARVVAVVLLLAAAALAVEMAASFHVI